MKTRRSRAKLEAMSPEALDASFPSARYFQVHFEYLHETIGDLKQQLHYANEQISGLQQQLQTVALNDLPATPYTVEPQSGVELRQS